MKSIIFTILVFFQCSFLLAQKEEKFNLYLQQSRYSKEAIKSLEEEQINVKNYLFIGSYYIDRKNEGIINYKTLEEGLDKIIPNKMSEDYLCLDIENAIYKSLKFSKSNSKEFRNNQKKLIELVKFVKNKRPNIKVTLYGIPFTFYWEDVPYKRFDKLIKQLDFISPHLYIYYPEKQVGFKANKNYLEKNLKVFLDYGERLDKPVIPFVWYRVHPSNKKFGSNILKESELKNYLIMARTFTHKKNTISGFLWWEPMNKEKIDINNILIRSFVE